jgi:superfamily II DNA/RNA helicase
LNGFSALRLSQPIMQAINSMGFEEPTPIQAASIPIALMGRDLIGQAETQKNADKWSKAAQGYFGAYKR